MAPSPPIGRERALQLVAEGLLPISFGPPQLTVMVVEQDGMFRLRELVVDRAGAEAAAAGARRARSPSWMPEHYYAVGRPTGQIFAEAPSRSDLVEVMRTIPWPAEW